MIFTRHACERYRQFHMLDQPAATDEAARAILEQHGGEAVKLPSKTIHGDEVWTIHALGIEIVVKRDTADPTCVTVLPPARFRGLTPLQAERIAVEQKAASARADELAREVAEIAEEVPARVPVTAEERRENHRLVQRAATARQQAKVARADADTLAAILKTMRTQLSADRDAGKLRAALKIAVRCLSGQMTSEAVEALQEIAEIDPGLVTGEFCGVETVAKFTASRRVVERP